MAAINKWVMSSNGVTIVNDITPKLSGSNLKELQNSVWNRWGALISKYASINQIPPAHLAALIWRESSGNPKARNTEKKDNPNDDGIGLMQLTSIGLKTDSKGNRIPDEQLFDPETNIAIGSKYFASKWHQHSGDLPKAAAAYNAGSVKGSSKNAWGMVQTCALNDNNEVVPGTCHDDAVVAASNSGILDLGIPGTPQQPSRGAPPQPIAIAARPTTAQLVAVGVVASILGYYVVLELDKRGIISLEGSRTRSIA